MLAQCRPLIRRAKQALALQVRHDALDKFAEGARQVRRGDHKAIRLSTLDFPKSYLVALTKLRNGFSLNRLNDLAFCTLGDQDAFATGSLYTTRDGCDGQQDKSSAEFHLGFRFQS